MESSCARRAVPDANEGTLSNNGPVGERFEDGVRQRSDESWVEIASQPSSSSLASSAAAEEIVTTGLRVRRHSNLRRSRRSEAAGPSPMSLPAHSSSAGSSQEEYEDSESDEDEQAFPRASQVGISPPLPTAYESNYDDDDDDDDENATALGARNDQAFTPQPNAFSHPPSSHMSRDSAPASYFPRQSGALRGRGHSYPSRRPPQHTPYNFISPSYQADHDAALRASLSTLLSCAAAARGLPKQNNGAGPATRSVPSSSRPSTFRILPESAMPGTPEREEAPAVDGAPTHKLSSSTSTSELALADKGKRKAGSSAARSGKERASKKTRRMLEENITPTLLTWVVSAGVVVIVSAISFSAGYAMGREGAFAEVGFANTTEGSDCGKEALRGLRKFRWSAAGASSVVV